MQPNGLSEEGSESLRNIQNIAGIQKIVLVVKIDITYVKSAVNE